MLNLVLYAGALNPMSFVDPARDLTGKAVSFYLYDGQADTRLLLDRVDGEAAGTAMLVELELADDLAPGAYTLFAAADADATPYLPLAQWPVTVVREPFRTAAEA